MNIFPSRWKFRTEHHDIKFGITCIDAKGDSHPTIRHRRLASHQIEESGAIPCVAPATCKFNNFEFTSYT